MICKFIQINLRKMCRIPHLLVFPVNMMHSQLTGINQLLSLQFNITFIFFCSKLLMHIYVLHLTDNYKRGSSRQGYSENDLINSRLVIGEGFFAAIYFWSGVDASVFLSVFFYHWTLFGLVYFHGLLFTVYRDTSPW